MRPASFPAPDGLLLTDGGLETSLIYDHGVDLPSFAAFPLLDSEAGRAVLARYFEPYLDVARRHGTGFVFETPTWRASRDWGAALGYDESALERVNRQAIAWIRTVADASGVAGPSVVSGNVGPRGDGYVVGETMSAAEAEAYHRPQVDAFAAAGADVATALTMTYVDEAIGIARAAQGSGLPSVISFTLETDGRLPSGESLGRAIERVDAEVPGAVAH
jgi:homocysteine S-methyltransferase